MTTPSRNRLSIVAQTTITMERDSEDFVGNCSSIDPVTDKAQEDRIRQELADGNDWAWCVVSVEVSWGGKSKRNGGM